MRSSFAVLLGLLAVAMLSKVLATQAGSVVRLRPASQSIEVGTMFTISLWATDLKDLGAYETQLEYDPAVLRYVDYADSGFLGSSGRTVQCTGAVVDDEEGTVQLGCGSLGPEPPGPSAADARLVSLRFEAIGRGSSNLTFLRAELVRPDGDTCCEVTGVQEAAVAVGDEDSLPPPPPTPTPDPRRLTPAAPPGGEDGTPYAVLPTPDAPVAADGAPEAPQQDPPSGPDGGSETAGAPVAGTGGPALGGRGGWVLATGGLLAVGLLLVVGGRLAAARGSRRD